MVSEDFIGGQFDLSKAIKMNIKHLEKLRVGGRASSVYLSDNTYNGTEEVKGTRENGYQMTLGPKSIMSGRVEENLSIYSLKVHGTDVYSNLPDNFRGIDFKIGGKLLFGLEFEVSMGYLK